MSITKTEMSVDVEIVVKYKTTNEWTNSSTIGTSGDDEVYSGRNGVFHTVQILDQQISIFQKIWWLDHIMTCSPFYRKEYKIKIKGFRHNFHTILIIKKKGIH